MLNLFFIIFFGFSSTYAQEKLSERLEHAQKKARKPAKRLAKHQKSNSSNRHLNGEVYTNLLEVDNLTQEHMQKSMSLEIEYLSNCLKNNMLSLVDRKWIENLLKIATKLMEPYYIYPGKYAVQECSSIIGYTTYDVIIERDPTNPGQFIIKNFYNNNHMMDIPVIQTGKNLSISPITRDASRIETLTSYNFPPVTNEKEKTYRQQCNSLIKPEVFENGNFRLLTKVDDGSEADFCTMSFSRIKE